MTIADTLVYTVYRSDDGTNHIFSTVDKAFDYSSKCQCPCVVSEYLVDNPERFYKVTQ